MGKRHPNPNLVKLHRSYTVEELAKRFALHANTIRAWREQGLTPNDDTKPLLFHGSAVAAFLRARRLSGKRPCQPGQIFCLACREPKSPALRMADYVPLNRLRGNLEALCPDCGRLVYRAVSRAGLDAIKGDLEVTVRDGAPRI
jgi:hypothetical protein